MTYTLAKIDHLIFWIHTRMLLKIKKYSHFQRNTMICVVFNPPPPPPPPPPPWFHRSAIQLGINNKSTIHRKEYDQAIKIEIEFDIYL